MANGIPEFLLPNDAYESAQPDYMKSLYNYLEKTKPKKQPEQTKTQAANAPSPAAALVAAAPEAMQGAAAPAQEKLSAEEQLLQNMLKGDPEQKAREAEMLERYLAGVDEQKAGLGESQKLLDLYKDMPVKEAGTNYKPLLSLIDSYAGTGLAKSVDDKKGETAEQRQYKIAQLSDLLAKRKGDISKSQADVLKQFSTKSDPMKDYLRAKAVEGTQERFDKREFAKAEQDVSKDVNDINKSMLDVDAQLGVAEQALASGRIDMLTPVLSILSRQVSGEKGVLTDRDVERTVPTTIATDIASLKAYLTNNRETGYPPEAVQGMQKLIAIAKEKRYSVFKNVLDKKENIWRSRETGAYKQMFRPGGSGDIIIQQARDTYNSLAQPPQSAPIPQQMQAPQQPSMQVVPGQTQRKPLGEIFGK